MANKILPKELMPGVPETISRGIWEKQENKDYTVCFNTWLYEQEIWQN